MPAWSVPGSHSVSLPCMRAWRTIASWRVTNIAWPMWRTPVTLGGGMATTKGGFLPPPEPGGAGDEGGGAARGGERAGGEKAPEASQEA